MQRVIRTLTRPNDNIGYDQGDVVAEPFTFHLNLGRGTYITTTSLVTDKGDHSESIRLHFFDANIPPQFDNLPMTTGMDVEDYLGFVVFKRFSRPNAGIAYSYGIMNSNPLQLIGKNGTADIQCILIATEAFNPTPEQKFCVSMNMEYV